MSIVKFECIEQFLSSGRVVQFFRWKLPVEAGLDGQSIMSSIITTSLDYCAISSEGHGLLPLGKNTKTAEYYLKLQSATTMIKWIQHCGIWLMKNLSLLAGTVSLEVLMHIWQWNYPS